MGKGENCSAINANPKSFLADSRSSTEADANFSQTKNPALPPGTKATIRVPEHPGKTYTGTVEASAQAVTAASGTTLMQIIVDNKAGELLPGSYASIRLAAAAVANTLSVPSSALIFDAKGLSLATVDANNHVQVKPVTLNRDLGAVVEIAAGISADDRVITNPPDGIASGDAVNIVGKPTSVAAGAAAPKPKADRG